MIHYRIITGYYEIDGCWFPIYSQVEVIARSSTMAREILTMQGVFFFDLRREDGHEYQDPDEAFIESLSELGDKYYTLN